MQIRLLSVLVASTAALIVFGAIGAWLGGAHKVCAAAAVHACVPVSLLQAVCGMQCWAWHVGACLCELPGHLTEWLLPCLQLRASSRVLVGGWLAMAITFGVGRLFGQGAA